MVLCTSFLIIPYLILKAHQNYEPIRCVKIITSKIISQHTCDNSHALEHGFYWRIILHILKYGSFQARVENIILIRRTSSCDRLIVIFQFQMRRDLIISELQMRRYLVAALNAQRYSRSFKRAKI